MESKIVPIGKSKFNYLLRVIRSAKTQRITTLEQFESFIKQSREIHVSKLNKPRIRGKTNYLAYINSTEWFNLKINYIKKYGKTCEICELKEGQDLHHMTYKRLGKEQDLDLLLLCRECHHAIHFGKEGIHSSKSKKLSLNFYWLRERYGFSRSSSELLLGGAD